jgi:nucleoside-triphosphatase THEP1
MTRIITGGVGGGKSTRFLRLFREEAAARAGTRAGAGGGQLTGLYSEKTVDARGAVTGYNLVLLPAWERLPFVLPRGALLPENAGNPGNYYFQGRFAFLVKTFEKASRHVLGGSAEAKHGPVWIDEIGNLELKGLGFDPLLRTLVNSGREITLTVRRSLLEKVVARYGIGDYAVIEDRIC